MSSLAPVLPYLSSSLPIKKLISITLTFFHLINSSSQSIPFWTSPHLISPSLFFQSIPIPILDSLHTSPSIPSYPIPLLLVSTHFFLSFAPLRQLTDSISSHGGYSRPPLGRTRDRDSREMLDDSVRSPTRSYGTYISNERNICKSCEWSRYE